MHTASLEPIFIIELCSSNCISLRRCWKSVCWTSRVGGHAIKVEAGEADYIIRWLGSLNIPNSSFDKSIKQRNIPDRMWLWRCLRDPRGDTERCSAIFSRTLEPASKDWHFTTAVLLGVKCLDSWLINPEASLANHLSKRPEQYC